MAAFFSWLYSQGWEGELGVLGVSGARAWGLAQIERGR